MYMQTLFKRQYYFYLLIYLLDLHEMLNTCVQPSDQISYLKTENSVFETTTCD